MKARTVEFRRGALIVGGVGLRCWEGASQRGEEEGGDGCSGSGRAMGFAVLGGGFATGERKGGGWLQRVLCRGGQTGG